MISRPASPVHLAVGSMLVLAGGLVMMARAGLAPWSVRVSLWSVLLVGFGLAKLVETGARSPRRGYVPLLLGVWLLAGDLGWVVRGDTWPLVLIAIGIAMVADVMWRPARPRTVAPLDGSGDGSTDGSTAALMIAGTVLAVVLIADTVSVFPAPIVESGDQVRVFSVMTRSRQASDSQQFRGGEITTLMAGSELDLRAAAPAPGAVVPLEVRTVMGGTVLRVPEQWTIDIQVLSVAGSVIDRRSPPVAATTGAPPRVVLRGLVLMGKLVIRS